MRVFISIDIPDEIKKEIVKIQNKIPEFKGKKTEFENLHLTLKFLGNVDENILKEVKKRLEKIDFKKFEASVNSIGVFNEKFIRIVWLKINGSEKLQKEIDDVLNGLFEKEKRFMGHLTIARVKFVDDKKSFLEKLKRINIEKIVFGIDKFKLKKSALNSSGAVYSDLAVYYLS